MHSMNLAVRTLACALAIASSGCSTFVNETNDAILRSKAEDALKFLAPESGRILACVKQAGGSCPANDLTLAEKKALDENEARDPEVKARALRALMGREGPATAPGKTVTDAALKSAAADAKAFALNPAQAAALASAIDTLASDTHVKLEKFYRQVSGEDGASATLSLTKDELRPYARSIQETTSQEGWAVLDRRIAAVIRGIDDKQRARGKSEMPAEDVALRAVYKAAQDEVNLIQAYLQAYFLDFRFVELEFDASNLQASVAAQVRRNFPKLSQSDADALVAKILRQLAGKPAVNGRYRLLTKAGTGGFVTRGGAKYVFPGVSLKIDPLAGDVIQASKIDFTEVGADIVRVVLEATGDALNQLPADPASTACELSKAGKLGGYPALRCYGSLPGGQSEQVSEAELSKVNDRASKVESYSATATGQLIRGVSWLSLNNEALAKLIETAVGVVARKATEKVTWCYYACKAKDPGTDPAAGESIKSIAVRVADVAAPRE